MRSFLVHLEIGEKKESRREGREGGFYTSKGRGNTTYFRNCYESKVLEIFIGTCWE